jgi:hypothetical protein
MQEEKTDVQEGKQKKIHLILLCHLDLFISQEDINIKNLLLPDYLCLKQGKVKTEAARLSETLVSYYDITQ